MNFNIAAIYNYAWLSVVYTATAEFGGRPSWYSVVDNR